MPYGKIVFSLALVVSLVMHLTAFLLLSDQDHKEATKDVNPVVSQKAMSIEVEQQKEFEKEKPIVPPLPEKSESENRKKQEGKSAPAKQKEAEKMGFAAMERAMKGEFPPLTIRYSDPERYVAEMIGLGACLALLVDKRDIWRIEVPAWKAGERVSAQMLENFSPFKRVVMDSVFEPRRVYLSNQVGSLSGDTEIVLLIPLKIEARWMGHQMLIFKNHGVSLDNVAWVEGTFSKGDLIIEKFMLSDGTVRRVKAHAG